MVLLHIVPLLFLLHLPCTAFVVNTHTARITSRATELMGSTEEQIARRLNHFTRSHVSVGRVVPCSTLSMAEVAKLWSALQPHQGPDRLSGLPADDGRRLVLPGRLPGRMPAHLQTQFRDAICAETLKLWAHHLPPAEKTASSNYTLPSMPEHAKRAEPLPPKRPEHVELPAMPKQTRGLSRSFNKLFSCLEGHQVPEYTSAEENWSGWPQWPLKGHFLSMGHGPFPFWHFGKAIAGLDDANRPHNAMALNVSFDRPYLFQPGNPMEVWYDMAQGITKFYHSNCDWILLDIPLQSGPCVHTMTGTYGPGQWLIFTADKDTKNGDNQFCCDDSFGGGAETLGTMNSKFMESLQYDGVVDHVGDYYTGKAKRYVQRLNGALNLDVWYETDLDGRPLRFAEVAWDETEKALYKPGGYLTGDMLPLIYTDYAINEWYKGAEALSDANFSIPDVCKVDNLQICGAPGEFMTEAEYEKNRGAVFWPICSFDLSSYLTDLPLQSSVICDETTGELIHDGTSALTHLRPQKGCHNYLVLDIHPDQVAMCSMGVSCNLCANIPLNRVTWTVAVNAETCESVGDICPSSDSAI